ncbi:MerR family transcriptional regulator [Nocardia sp. NPDC050793]|uniref:MerR family transcriptional regulator n=1 Tax=Nocardia sp. NPDC050793 TaxID=3155159 RepID=UPI0033C73FC1
MATQEAEFTIDELARAADTTVRSVRVYHERGLLPSPEVRGRIGYYGTEHLDRLQTISRLLGRGMKLNGIKELLEAWDRGAGLADVLGVPARTGAPALDPTATPDRTHEQPDLPDEIKRALLENSDPLDVYRIDSPQVYDLAVRLVDAGQSTADTMRLIEHLRADCDSVAERYFADLFTPLAIRRFERSAHTAQDRAKLTSDLAIARLIATRAVAELLDHVLARRLDAAASKPPTPATADHASQY